MATHSSILAWKIPWMEEPGRLQSMASQRVGQDLATTLALRLMVNLFGLSTELGMRDAVELEYIL